MGNLFSIKISRMHQEGWGPDADNRQTLTCDGWMDRTAACLCREGAKGAGGDFHPPHNKHIFITMLPLLQSSGTQKSNASHTGTFLSFYTRAAARKVQRNETRSVLWAVVLQGKLAIARHVQLAEP